MRSKSSKHDRSNLPTTLPLNPKQQAELQNKRTSQKWLCRDVTPAPLTVPAAWLLGRVASGCAVTWPGWRQAGWSTFQREAHFGNPQVGLLTIREDVHLPLGLCTAIGSAPILPASQATWIAGLYEGNLQLCPSMMLSIHIIASDSIQPSFCRCHGVGQALGMVWGILKRCHISCFSETSFQHYTAWIGSMDWIGTMQFLMRLLIEFLICRLLTVWTVMALNNRVSVYARHLK